MWSHDPLPRLPRSHPFADFFCVVTQQTAKFWGVGTGDPGVGPMTPKFELERDFCTVHLTAKFHHVESFGSIVLTNTQTNRRG